MDYYDYHIRLNLPEAIILDGQTIAPVTRYEFLFDWLLVHSFERFAMSIEERNTDKSHIHAFATLTVAHSRLIRELFRKTILPSSSHKRPYSVAKRRGNLLSYMMKDISDCICDKIEDMENQQLIVGDAHQPTFFSTGFPKDELQRAFTKSYPKTKIPKEDWHNKRQLAIINWKATTNYFILNSAQTANDFMDFLIDFSLKNTKQPPRQTFVNFWLLKLGIITPEQYRFRKYTDFF